MGETTGTVVSAKRQWWLKVNRKPFRSNMFDGAEFPYIIMVSYTVNGQAYRKRKWIPAGKPVPVVGSSATVFYEENNPKKANIFYL